ncbi:TPA: hypothetical protein N0F65_011385, partial [Lagenidium giganteum]
SSTEDCLEWWRTNGDRYPVVARLARKWLGCVATSVPSERDFPTGRNVMSAKRTALDAELVRDLVFISENVWQMSPIIKNPKW